MVVCELCGREMNEAEGCVPHRVELRSGAVVDSPKHYSDSSVGMSGRCHDCGAEVGGYHHPHCDSARNPGPGHQQLLSAAASYFVPRDGGDFDFSGGGGR